MSYELNETPAPELPKLPGQVIVEPTRADVFDRLAHDLMQVADQAVQERNVFHIALSGGSTPEPFYMSLVSDPRYRTLPWEKTHLWIVDERRVPEDHEKSNVRMIRESLTDHVDIPADQVHAMPVMESDPAELYEESLSRVFGITKSDLPPSLDFILLGMGDDLHTASLFPKTDALSISDRWIVVNEGDNVTPPDRVTMTYPLINHARRLAVLLIGEKKARPLSDLSAALVGQSADINTMPISGIDPLPQGGSLKWYLDHAAALV